MFRPGLASELIVDGRAASCLIWSRSLILEIVGTSTDISEGLILCYHYQLLLISVFLCLSNCLLLWICGVTRCDCEIYLYINRIDQAHYTQQVTAHVLSAGV